MKLLLVEDDPTFSMLAEKLISQLPFIQRVDTASTGIYATELLREFTYDVVLTDYDLGGHFAMNGLEVVYVAKFESRIPAPITILWSGIGRDREISQVDIDERPDWSFHKGQIEDVLSQLRSINDEINERVV